MKSLVPFLVAAILLGILIVGCGEGNPPANSYQVDSFDMRTGGSSQQIRGVTVTPIFFQSKNVLPLIGRVFLPEEYGQRQRQVVVLSYRFWQRQFSGDPRVIGSSMDLNGQTFTVIGVMPTAFDVPSGVDIWVPTTQ